MEVLDAHFADSIWFRYVKFEISSLHAPSPGGKRGPLERYPIEPQKFSIVGQSGV